MEVKHAVECPTTEYLCAAAKASRADVRRERLIDTARLLFSERGFHATGMAQIARRSGIAVGQIYRDFANKEEIVAEIVERDLSTYLDGEALRLAHETGDVAGVRSWIVGFVTGDEKDSEHRLVAEIIAESSRNHRIARIFQRVQTMLRERLECSLAVLAPEQAKAARRALLAEMILTLSAGVFHRRLADPDTLHPSLLDALTQSIQRELDTLVST